MKHFASPAIFLLLEELRLARTYAEDLGVHAYEFSKEIKPLRDCGVSRMDVKWMVLKKLVSETRLGDSSEPVFAITDSGLDFLNRQSRQKTKPQWIPEKRQLMFNGRLIKQFRVPSSNQETIFAAFEEEGWPERIYDPLIPKKGIAIKRRVAETIKSMNRWHLSLIHI